MVNTISRIRQDTKTLIELHNFSYDNTSDPTKLSGLMYGIDGTPYKLTIIFPTNYPIVAPHIIFSEELEGLLDEGEINLKSEWSADTNVTAIIDKLQDMIDKASRQKFEERTSRESCEIERINELVNESTKIAEKGHHIANYANGKIHNPQIELFGWDGRKYEFQVNFEAFPDSPPQVIFLGELRDLLSLQTNSLQSIQSWNPDTSHVSEVIDEISQTIMRETRIRQEIEYLKHAYPGVTYDSYKRKIQIVFSTKSPISANFKFEICFPEKYPYELDTSNPSRIIPFKPQILFETELEDVRDEVKLSIEKFLTQWQPLSPSSFLSTFFSNIGSIIGRATTSICSICFQQTCPTTGQHISNGIKCPHCDTVFHQCCAERGAVTVQGRKIFVCTTDQKPLILS